MKRIATKTIFIEEIINCMVNKNMESNPSKILDYFKDKAFSGDEKTQKIYEDYPMLRTIKKHMKDVHDGKYALKEQRVDFEYGVHMGSGENQVPWELSQHAMECLRFYVEEYGVKPCVGLTKRYAQIANVYTVKPDSFEVATRAEKIWYADLIGDIPSRERPSTVFEDVELSFNAAGIYDQDRIYKALIKLTGSEMLGTKEVPKAKRLVIPEQDWEMFLRFMPVFSHGWNRYLTSQNSPMTFDAFTQLTEVFGTKEPENENDRGGSDDQS